MNPCRIYWLGQIDEKLGHRVPEHLFKDGSANDLRAYLEEEIEKCKNQSARNGDAAATTVGNAVPETMETPTTPTDANTLPAPGCPADAGSATQSLSAAGPASLEAEPEATPFDYSGLDAQTVADLHLAEREYLGGRKLAEMGLRRMADGVAIAHDALCGGCDNLSQAHNNQYSKDTFGAWCGSIGIHRKAAERLLQVSKLLDNSTPREQKVLEELVYDENVEKRDKSRAIRCGVAAALLILSPPRQTAAPVVCCPFKAPACFPLSRSLPWVFRPHEGAAPTKPIFVFLLCRLRKDTDTSIVKRDSVDGRGTGPAEVPRPAWQRAGLNHIFRERW